MKYRTDVVPVIPVAARILEQERVGNILVYQPPGISMEFLVGLCGDEKFQNPRGERLGGLDCSEPYFTQTMRPGWRLVTREAIADSYGGYLRQTNFLARHLVRSVIPLRSDDEQSLEDLAGRRLGIEHELRTTSDWSAVSEKLVSLEINQRYRDAPVELLWRSILYESHNNQRMFTNTRWVWTNTLSRRRRPVIFAQAKPQGVYLEDAHPNEVRNDVGVCFSRGV